MVLQLLGYPPNKCVVNTITILNIIIVIFLFSSGVSIFFHNSSAQRGANHYIPLVGKYEKGDGKDFTGLSGIGIGSPNVGAVAQGGAAKGLTFD